MNNTTLLVAYFITLGACLALTVGIIVLITKGLRQYFENLARDNDIAKFFVRLTTVILLLAGFGAALQSVYHTEKANWLTLTWDIADHVESSLEQLFLTLITLAIAFLILHVVAKLINK